MKISGILLATLLIPAIVLASSNSLEAAEETPYLLQDHGTVRVLRGLEPEKNFETAHLPAEVDLAPAAAATPQVEPRRIGIEPRGRDPRRGITVHRAADPGWIPYSFRDRTRLQRVHRTLQPSREMSR